MWKLSQVLGLTLLTIPALRDTPCLLPLALGWWGGTSTRCFPSGDTCVALLGLPSLTPCFLSSQPASRGTCCSLASCELHPPGQSHEGNRDWSEPRRRGGCLCFVTADPSEIPVSSPFVVAEDNLMLFYGSDSLLSVVPDVWQSNLPVAVLRVGGKSGGEQALEMTQAFHLLLERLMVYITARCWWATPFLSLPLEVLVLSGLESSKEFRAKLLKLFSFCLLQQHMMWEITWLRRWGKQKGNTPSGSSVAVLNCYFSRAWQYIVW